MATVEDGRVTALRGARDHPITRGSLCAKVNDYHTRPYATDRLLAPLRRAGPKGSGAFETVPWDAALDLIAERFAAIMAEDGPEALLPHFYLGSMGVVQRRALQRLFHALGASRFHGSVCGAAGNAAVGAGFPIGFDPEEMVNARFAIVWGANPLTTCHHNWHFLAEARRRHGARIVCIDPRRTRTARAADEHIAIRPGTDWALAAGMGRELLAADLADDAFLGRVAVDLDRYRDQVAAWTPERVAGVTGVEAATVVRLAHEFGSAQPALLRVGIGIQQSVSGDALVLALSALAMLGGHWQHAGGGLFLEAYPDFRDQAAGCPDLVTGNPRSLDMARLGEHLTSDTLAPPVRGLMVWTSNPAVVQPDVLRVRTGLMREDLFTVVLDHFLTDTARYADVVLPSTTQLEHFDVLGAWGHHYVTVNLPAIAPLGEAKPHVEILHLLADRLGLDHPALHETAEEIAASALPDGLDLPTLMERGWHKTLPARFEVPTEPSLRLVGPVPDLPASGRGDRLQLLTPKSHFFLNSTFANMPRHRRAMERPTLELHPTDAAQRGIADGDEVVVSGQQASLHAWARLTDGVLAGVVVLPGKWWSVPDSTDAVANALIPGAWSPGGQPAYNDVWVEVRPTAGGTGPH